LKDTNFYWSKERTQCWWVSILYFWRYQYDWEKVYQYWRWKS